MSVWKTVCFTDSTFQYFCLSQHTMNNKYSPKIPCPCSQLLCFQETFPVGWDDFFSQTSSTHPTIQDITPILFSISCPTAFLSLSSLSPLLPLSLIQHSHWVIQYCTPLFYWITFTLLFSVCSRALSFNFIAVHMFFLYDTSLIRTPGANATEVSLFVPAMPPHFLMNHHKSYILGMCVAHW